MLRNHFLFQNSEDNPLQFIPVVENKVGEGDEPFLTDYPRNMLLRKDTELVPWMVGFTAKDGGLFTAFFPHLFPNPMQEGEKRLLYQIHVIYFCLLELSGYHHQQCMSVAPVLNHSNSGKSRPLHFLSLKIPSTAAQMPISTRVLYLNIFVGFLFDLVSSLSWNSD